MRAEDAVVVYRRTRERMPAHDFEVEEALEEGVSMKWLSTIKQADDGKLVLERMELDETGLPQPTAERRVPARRGVVDPPRREVVSFDRLDPWHYADAPMTVRPQPVLARPQSTFDEVTGGLADSNALFEARRCLPRGNCCACDSCRESAAIKPPQPGPYAHQTDVDYCKGCGLCAAECPCGAIEMEAETI